MKQKLGDLDGLSELIRHREQQVQRTWTDLKMGLSMAQLRAAPRETHSLALSVLPGSLPKKSLMILSKAGTLELPPTTSTVWMSACEIWASSSAYNITCSLFIQLCSKRGTQTHTCTDTGMCT